MQRGTTTTSRRQFVQAVAATGLAVGAFPYFVRAQDPNRPLKIGLIGCGDRGTAAARNALEADRHVRIVALADAYQDRMDTCRKTLREKVRVQVEDAACFIGFDAYQKVLATDVDYVILATPPHYRPEQFEAAVKAGKHVFTEKPAAVDPVGIRRFMAAGEAAKEQGLCVVAGTQRRHEPRYVETIKRIHDGAIGDIVAGQCYWIDNSAEQFLRPAGWDDLRWMIRDWYNWRWLSGDHVVEQHVHNIDVINWATGRHPLKVLAMGGRARRVTGDQFDFFSADLYYPADDKDREGRLHVLSQCRQVNGCGPINVSERVVGTKGYSDCKSEISTVPGYRPPRGKPYVQEHKDLITAIRAGQPLNEAQQVAESTLCGIMIRMSAYTGKPVTWYEALKSDIELKAPDYELTPDNIRQRVPVPGEPAGVS